MKIDNLVKSAKKGNREAFNQLIIEYQDVLYRIAKSKLNSEDDVCDVVQSTLLSAYRHLTSLKNDKYFKTWLIKILINKCNDFYLYKKNYIPYDEIEDYNQNISDDFTNDFGIDYLLKPLNNDEKTILALYYAEGYDEKEIADILNINYSTIRSKIRRAKDKIAKELKREVN